MMHLLLCAYNEEKDLPGLLEDIGRQGWQWHYRVVVVDDGSTDGTGRILGDMQARMPLEVIRHPENRGLGAALAAGLAAVIDNIGDGDMVVTMDADRTHPPEMIPLLREKIADGYDIAIASRFAPGGGQSGLPLYRRLLSRGAGIVLGAAWPVRGVRDYTCGFRAFSGKLLKEARRVYGGGLVTETGFAATFEVLLKTGSLGGKIAEVPLRLHYENKTGKSKMKIAATIGRYLRLAVIAATNKRCVKQNA